jgi:hypothetical protein
MAARSAAVIRIIVIGIISIVLIGILAIAINNGAITVFAKEFPENGYNYYLVIESKHDDFKELNDESRGITTITCNQSDRKYTAEQLMQEILKPGHEAVKILDFQVLEAPYELDPNDSELFFVFPNGPGIGIQLTKEEYLQYLSSGELPDSEDSQITGNHGIPLG